MNLKKLPWRKSVAFLGMGFWASSLALLSPIAQSQSNDTAYCFAVQTPINIYESPSFRAMTADSYAAGDVAYATTNPPQAVWVRDGTGDGNSFVEVAFYDGNIGWIPRYPAGSDSPALIDLSGSADCPAPGLNAAGGDTGGSEYCFFVQRPTNVYSRPTYSAITGDSYAAGDTAYATTDPPISVWIDDPDLENGNSFIEVEIYGDNTAWVPRFRADADVPLLVDLADCP